jgi:hypothetical protein
MAYIRPPNSVLAGDGLYQDPIASAEIPSGVLPVTFNLSTATTSTIGGVIIGNNINVTPDGVISVADAGSGYTGSVGAQGPQGINGYYGSTGAQGSRGYNGSVGMQGSQGFTGSFGFSGSVGTQGFAGSVGIKGFTGSVGAQGPQGPQGSIGYTGSSGEDDYTFGSWQPALIPNVSGTIALSTRNANYAKFGQMVFCTFDIKVTSITGGASTATVILSGLPVTAISSTGTVGSVFISFNYGLDTNIVQLSGTVINSSKQANLWYSKSVGQDLTSLTQDELKTNAILTGTVSYISAT